MCFSDLLGQVPLVALKLKEAARLGLADVYVLDYRLDGWLSRHAKGVVQYSIENTGRVIEGLERRSAVGLRPLLQRGADVFEKLTVELRKSSKGLIVFGLDGSNALFAHGWTKHIAQLAESLGDGWHLLPVTAARNATGAFVVGCQPDRLPGGWTDDADRREKVGRTWGKLPPQQPGMSAPEMIEAAREGRLKALYLLGAGDFQLLPWLDDDLSALDRLELLVVHDVFPSPLSERAGIVLPGALFFEKEGTLLDVCGLPARLAKGWLSSDDIRDEVAVLAGLAQELGEDLHLSDTNAVFEEMMKIVNPRCPLRAGALCVEGPGDESPIRCLSKPRAGVRLQEGKFYSVCSTYAPVCRLLPGDRSRAIELADDREMPSAKALGLKLVWSPILRGCDPLGDRSQTMAPLRPEKWIEMHPEDAEALKLSNGDAVIVSDETNTVQASGRLCVTEKIARGLVYAPQNRASMHFGRRPVDLPVVSVRKAM